jgi:hypothetical protein
MAHGGARQGAGRKSGAASIKTREIADEAAKSGITPLEYMLAVLRDEDRPGEERMEAAKSAAPYCHPRLNAISGDLRVGITHEQALAALT